jgi:hypothetical protein
LVGNTANNVSENAVDVGENVPGNEMQAENNVS